MKRILLFIFILSSLQGLTQILGRDGYYYIGNPYLNNQKDAIWSTSIPNKFGLMLKTDTLFKIQYGTYSNQISKWVFRKNIIYIDTSQHTGGSGTGDTCFWNRTNDTLNPKHNHVFVPKFYPTRMFYQGGNGDINNSGTISATDAVWIRSYLAGLVDFDYYKKFEADVDGDGFITTTDADLIEGMTIATYPNSLTYYDSLKRIIGRKHSGLNPQGNFNVRTPLALDTFALMSVNRIVFAVIDTSKIVSPDYGKVGYIPLDSLLAYLSAGTGDTCFFYRNGINGWLYPKTITDRLGIGTATPTEMLDVQNGNINMDITTSTTGQIKQNGITLFHTYTNNVLTPNTFIGLYSGNYTTTGTQNIGIGYATLASNTTGNQNTTIGDLSLISNTTGNYNTSVGVGALQNNTEGVVNTAVGISALTGNVGGDQNTAVGGSALLENTEGYFNTGIGSAAGYRNNTGFSNTAIGANALYGTLGESQTGNTAIGVSSLLSIGNNGNYNVSIGYSAGDSITTGDYNILIGNEAGGKLITESNKLYIEPSNADSNGALIFGNFAINKLTVNGNLKVTGLTTLAVPYVVGVDANGDFYRMDTTGMYGGGGAGDNLGNHIATQMLDMDGNDIGDADSIFANTINLSTTTSTIGQIKQAGVAVFHTYSADPANPNIWIGVLSGNYATTSKSSIGIGDGTLNNITNGLGQIAIGKYSQERVIGNYNTSLGHGSLRGSVTPANNTGLLNIAIGYNAFSALTSGSYGVAIGNEAGTSVTTANNNVFIGSLSGNKTISGFNNTAIGSGSMYSNKNCYYITAIGYNAMYYADDRTSGRAVYNTAVGYEAMKGSSTAANNTGRYNTAIGYQSLVAMTSGNQNAAIGYNALYRVTSGSGNTAIGYNAAQAITTTSYNTAIGYHSMYQNTGGSNVAIGQSTLNGSGNGSNNIAIGPSALTNNTTGSYNTAVGISALNKNVAGGYNTAIGYQANYNANDAVGTTNTFNVAIGKGAMYGSATPANNTGVFNTAIGSRSLENFTSCDSNTIIGYLAGSGLTSGSNNTLIGFEAGSSLTTENNQVHIGNTNNTDTYLNGTVHYNDTHWLDATVSAYSLAGGVNAPTLKAITGTLMGQGFNPGVANDEAYGQAQMNHYYKLGTDIESHVHYTIDDPPVGGNDTVVIEFEYSWADINEAFPASTTVTKKIVIDGKSVGTHYLNELVAGITGNGGDALSSVIAFRIERVQNNPSDTYPGWWILLDVDFHHQIDSPGSDEELVK